MPYTDFVVLSLMAIMIGVLARRIILKRRKNANTPAQSKSEEEKTEPSKVHSLRAVFPADCSSEPRFRPNNTDHLHWSYLVVVLCFC